MKVIKKYRKEFYIDEIIKKASILKFNVKVLEDEHYINFGTPDLVKDFIFGINILQNDL